MSCQKSMDSLRWANSSGSGVPQSGHMRIYPDRNWPNWDKRFSPVTTMKMGFTKGRTAADI